MILTKKLSKFNKTTAEMELQFMQLEQKKNLTHKNNKAII